MLIEILAIKIFNLFIYRYIIGSKRDLNRVANLDLF
jgi:hypothetical protein